LQLVNQQSRTFADTQLLVLQMLTEYRMRLLTGLKQYFRWAAAMPLAYWHSKLTTMGLDGGVCGCVPHICKSVLGCRDKYIENILSPQVRGWMVNPQCNRYLTTAEAPFTVCVLFYVPMDVRALLVYM
jgi:hypothetical protein